jgi:hypothetical protein
MAGLRIYEFWELPTIPDSIDLLADQRLLGWDAFFGTIETDDADWKMIEATSTQAVAPGSGVILRGGRKPIVAGSHCERLLRYHRPILEDGSLSYEFYYQAGVYTVHPSIGDLVYLLNSDASVFAHRITDGINERMGRRPVPPSTHNKSIVGVELRHGDWNRIDIKIRGDQIQLSLNGGIVHESTLAKDMPRVFGLFHFCDQTEALVRNVRWKGTWPKTLDIVAPQELEHDPLDEILAGSSFKQTFRHNFADGVPLESFAITGDGWKENLTPLDNGVRLVRPGGKFVEYAIKPNLQLVGDFDVIAEFESFVAKIDSGGDANIKLMLGFLENSADYRLYRKFSRFAKKELGHQIIQAAYFYTREGHRNYEFPKMTSESAAGGKLRFIRRGDRLHYLFAAHDTDYYRLLHSEQVSREPTRPNSFALGIETTKAGEASVVWKSLEVRAEQMTGAALEKNLTVDQLNKSRDDLPSVIDLNFADPSIAQRIQTWGTDTTFQYRGDGLLVSAPGFKDWHGHGVSPNVTIQDDFDIQLKLEMQHLQPPEPGGECVVYLEAGFPDRRQTSIQAKFAMTPSGAKNGELSHHFTADNGERHYDELVNYPLDLVHSLRIARRGKTVYVLIQASPTSGSIVLGRVRLDDDAVDHCNIQAVVHTSGVDRTTVALYKQMTIWAKSIQE